MTKKKGITASDIRSSMEKRWKAPEYAIMWEVADATGFGAGRRADAVIMSLWPSRGLELHGIEIKVSREDWKREAADPTKAEAVGQYCDRWWVHTAPGVVDDISDVPPAWGLREWNGSRWVTRKEAEKTEVEPISRAFLAAMLRRADGLQRTMMEDARREASEALEAEMEKIRDRGKRNEERFREEVKQAVERRAADLERKMDRIREFQAAFGEGMLRNWGVDLSALGQAALLLHRCKLGHIDAQELSSRLRAAADQIDGVTSLFVPPPETGTQAEAS